MTSKILTLSLIASSALVSIPAFAEEVTFDPIVVGADFREQNLSKVSSSVSIISEADIYDKASQSFVEVLASEPNVNFSAGASKAKYIQIRGIGERSQFITPVNPSVGVILDGIDFSQSALGVTMYDLKQIEVLRGPQGTTFGANGMAGVINIESNDPTNELGGHVEATVGNYNTKAFGVTVNAPIVEDTLLSRFSVYKNKSDGYMNNTFLGRDDTQNIDELSAKAKFRWFAADNHTIDLTLQHINIDNGYDAFTFDNSRNSHADEPGTDAQKTNAFALKSTYQVNEAMHLISAVSYSQSDLEYSYDEDWSYVGEFDASLYPYQGFDQYLRDREQLDIDVRMVSDQAGRIFNGTTDWTVGAYYKDYSEEFNRNHSGDYGYGAFYDTFNSQYDTKNKAVYGQLDTHFNDKLTLVTGLRLEQWDSEYSDSASVAIKTDEFLTGGKIGLNYQESADRLYYITLAKGYKPGGVNADTQLSLAERQYETETLWNIDAGLNSNYYNNKVKSRFNLFYGKRKDQQVKDSKIIPIPGSDAVEFVDFTGNAGEGHYYGLESQIDYFPLETLHLFTSFGLLQAEIDEFPSNPAVEGRAPAHSPEYQYNVGLDYFFLDAWTFKTNVEGKGSYYFSNRHDEKSDSYTLWHSSLEYTTGAFTAAVWVRNITDEEYFVRGFGSFPNNPGDGYTSTRYTQLGTPRTAGLTLSYDF